jgi:hypothetical protein
MPRTQEPSHGAGQIPPRRLYLMLNATAYKLITRVDKTGGLVYSAAQVLLALHNPLFLAILPALLPALHEVIFSSCCKSVKVLRI